MKRSRLTYDEWDGVVRQKEIYINNIKKKSFQGYIGKILLQDVTEPQIF